MKTAHVLLVAFCSLLCGCGKTPELPYQIDGAVQQKLTNDVIGFSRLVKVDMEKYEGGPTNWLANITAEYVNRNGGIERTNLYYRFGTREDGRILWATLDEQKLAEQSHREFEEQLRTK